MLTDRLQQRVDEPLLNAVRRIPGEPLIEVMFGQDDVGFRLDITEQDDIGFVNKAPAR